MDGLENVYIFWNILGIYVNNFGGVKYIYSN